MCLVLYFFFTLHSSLTADSEESSNIHKRHQLVTGRYWFLLQGGMYVLQLMDYYSAGFCVLVIAIIECFVINWIYGQYDQW